MRRGVVLALRAPRVHHCMPHPRATHARTHATHAYTRAQHPPTSMGEIFSPPRLISSLMRPVSSR